MKKLLVIAAAAALASVSLAQGGGGRMFMMGGGGMSGGARLAMRADVAKELKLSSDQKVKIEDMMESMRGQGFRVSGPGGGGPGGGEQPDMSEMRKRAAERREQERVALAKILDADQIKRLKELGIQRSGISAITDADVQKDLKFTADQKTKVETLQKKQMEAMMAVGEKIRNQEIDRDEARGIFEKNRKIMDEELAKVLTAEQKKMLADMGGKPFTFDPDEERGPGGL